MFNTNLTMKIKKIKKKHILNMFSFKPKKFKFYYKPRSFFKYNHLNSEKLLVNNSSYYKIYSIVSLNSLYLNIAPLLACIKYLKKKLKLLFIYNSLIKLYVFPDFVVTAKPREVRMGGGKGDPAKNVCLVNKGAIIFSITNLKPYHVNLLLMPCKFKLPFLSVISSYVW